MREALYVKDDDFRLSFTHGQYITASGLTEADIDRIVKQRMSPLYISVHVTDHKMRCKMLGIAPSKTPDILDMLRLFKKKRIEFHAQIVLCPGWNDGALLDKTLNDLTTLVPAMQSIAIVPVGLTAHREGLANLHPMTPEIAETVIRQVEPHQKTSRQFSPEGHRTILLADEFYMIAGLHPPKYTATERDCQIENGVGMVETFWMGWTVALRKARTQEAAHATPQPRKKALLLTGLSA
ncbi:TPA: hypothetical protein DDW35_07680, partial [Candidatus Sumerlaeota bacterium]|nr:hypothetical protein [Candidatus Sumerlaeota bacterium]